MYSFNLKEGAAWQLRHRLGLSRQKLLGRGSFSAVFAHPDQSRNSVIKLTTDKAGYAYLDEGSRCYDLDRFSCFPKIVDMHEDLNEELLDQDSPFRVVELERLAPAKRAGLERRLLTVYAARSFSDLTPYPVTESDEAWAEQKAKSHPELCALLMDFGERLGTFCADYHFRLDGLTGGNSMTRGDEVVFNDPVFCPKAMEAIRTRRSRARPAFH